MKHGNHILKTWSVTQSVIATSSGEAEYYGTTKGASQAMGMKALMMDMGLDVGITVETDSTAAKGIAHRKGLGKVRHIEVCQLWLQEKVRNGTIKLVNIKGTQNPADVLTKHLGNEVLKGHIENAGIVQEPGRHTLSPETARDEN